jgi:hypothetical protein
MFTEYELDIPKEEAAIICIYIYIGIVLEFTRNCCGE